MNSITKTAAKMTEELRQPNEKSNAIQEGIQHTKARLGEVLTFKNRASYIQDGHTATLQILHFVYFFQQI
jgi:hypothetical protein